MDILKILELPEKARYVKLSDDLLELQKTITHYLSNENINKVELIEKLAKLHITLSIMVTKGDISHDYLKQATEFLVDRLDPEQISKLREICEKSDCHLKLVRA